VFVERCLHEQRSESEAQSVVSVPDAGLPAWGAGLQQKITSYSQLQPVTASYSQLQPVTAS